MTDTHDPCDLRGVYLDAHCGGCENTYPRDLEHTDWRFWAFCSAECEQDAMRVHLAQYGADGGVDDAGDPLRE